MSARFLVWFERDRFPVVDVESFAWFSEDAIEIDLRFIARPEFRFRPVRKRNRDHAGCENE